MSAPTAPAGIRIGTAEREAAISALGEHMVAGRLEPDEYGDRVASSSAARVQSELDVLFTDLPAPRPSASTPAPSWRGHDPQRRWQRFVPASIVGRVVLAAAVVLIFLMSLPFLLVGAILWFVVLPRLTCGGPWHRQRGWHGYARRW